MNSEKFTLTEDPHGERNLTLIRKCAEVKKQQNDLMRLDKKKKSVNQVFS